MSRANTDTRKDGVLIVDQDGATLRNLGEILRSRGFSVRSASSGSEALRCIRSGHPALVLLASKLQGMDGFEVLRHLMQSRSRVPLLLITDRSDIATQRAGLKLGAADIICKPFHREEVIARVKVYSELGTLRKRLNEMPKRNVEVREHDTGIRLAREAGPISTFQWNAATDGVHRSQLRGQVPSMERQDFGETGRNWFRRIHRDDIARILRVLSLLSPDYDSYDTHYRIFRQDGVLIHVRESARAFFDAGGRLIRLTGSVTDITEQEQREDVLRQTMVETLELIQKAPLPVAFADARGDIRYVNDRFVQAFGYLPEEIAQSDTWWMRAVPEARQREELIRTFRDNMPLEGRGSVDASVTQCRLTCKDGTSRIVEIFGSAAGDRKLIFINDVTERRQSEAALYESEQRFRNLADSAPVMVWVSGPDKLCTFVNKAWLQFTGRTMREELGAGWADSLHPDDRERCVKIYITAFDARREFCMEYRLRRYDGEYGWIQDRGAPRFTNTGAFAGYIGSCTDITEFKHRQEQMVATQRLEGLGVLAGGIAHDFNNILGCIMAWADVTMISLDANAPAREGIRKIETLAVRASEIVGQIRTYAGRDEIQKEPVYLARLVEEMLELLRVCIPKRSEFRVKLTSDLPALHGNPSQLRQVVMNLVLNATEALKERAGMITIRVRRKQLSRNRRIQNTVVAQGEYVCLEVSDTGSGMSKGVRMRIFEPFFTTKSTGTGLGLSAVLGIVRSHGGTIHVVSAPGKGTKFQILLPPASAAQEHEAPSSAPRTFSAASGTMLAPENEEGLHAAVSKGDGSQQRTASVRNPRRSAAS